ncbi:Craniofacial development protein 1 [Bulinus truncatus]|nr:Craniofacial development protein 1 [Bulinus truncatus]
MSDDEDYNSEEDVDYVPSEGEQLSEEENSGDEEDLTVLQDEETSKTKGTTKSSTQKKKTLISNRRRRGGIKLENIDKAADPSIVAEKKKKKEGKRKRKKELKIYGSFKSDIKLPSKSSSGSGLGSLTSHVKTSIDSNSSPLAAPSDTSSSDKSKKVTITKVFDFAGEEIKITKEVDADSKEAKEEQKKQEMSTMEETVSPDTASSSSVGLGIKRPAVGGGLGSVLNKITKKNKMGTLEKSKIDWDVFKRKEGIEDDLKIHNKGKQGYTERMAFLNRTDQRQFEIERALRLGSTSKR